MVKSKTAPTSIIPSAPTSGKDVVITFKPDEPKLTAREHLNAYWQAEVAMVILDIFTPNPEKKT